jgi:serine protease
MSRERSRAVARSAAAFAAVLLVQGLPVAADVDVARVIVKFRTGTALTSASVRSSAESAGARALALGARLGLTMSAGTTISDRVQVVVATGLTSADLAGRLAREGDVEYAVPDERRHIVRSPNDPLYAEGVSGNGPAAGQWYLRAPSGEVRSSLDIEPAWALTVGSPQVVVAVLDGGVRYEHPDLLEVAVGGNLLPGYDMVSDATVANDGDGRDGDASDPGDWVTQAEIAQPGGPFFRCADSPQTSSWHGTQVSGLIAATTHNGIGMASTAPGVRVLPVRVLGKCGGRDSDILAAMRWATGLSVPGVPANPYPARVINLSLGGEESCSAAYRDAVDEITAAGTVIVAAAGNTSGQAVATPANCPGVIAVAGLRHAGTKVGFSSLGSEVAISAPGGNCVNSAADSACLYPILTTTDSGTTVPAGSSYTDAFNTSIGTSFSAPLVAGVAALVLSLHPTLTPAQVKELLQRTARPFPAQGSIPASSTAPECTPPQFTLTGRPADQLECYCTATTCGAGMLDAAAALAAAEASSR